MNNKMLNEILNVGEERAVVTKFEENPGYTQVLEFGEFLVCEGIDFNFEEIETVLVEMPENDYRKFDGYNYVAVYEVVNFDLDSNITYIKRIK